MRGKGVDIGRVGGDTGITPAHAGKRRNLLSRMMIFQDHPRTCGEKRFNRDQTILTTGSPPHMRGKDAFISPYGDIPGITPAHAGKRIGFSAFSGLSGDHPRTCGEKSLMRSLHTGRLGSPPHMRGKVGHCLASNSILGITPAHAGKRTVWPCVPAHSGDHPRTCGEKSFNQLQTGIHQGSPPHMRGKVAPLVGE